MKSIFIGVNFETNEKREKIWIAWVLTKLESWAARDLVFVYAAVFERARNYCVKKVLCASKIFRSFNGFLSSFGFEKFCFECVSSDLKGFSDSVYKFLGY